VGESPALHMSGSHHPALSEMQTNTRQPSHSFSKYIPAILAYSLKICKHFFLIDEGFSLWYAIFRKER